MNRNHECEHFVKQLEEWDEGLGLWSDRTVSPELTAAFEQWLPIVDKARARVRLMFLVAIHKLLEDRIKWLLWERATQAPVLMKEMMETATPEEQEKVLAAFRAMSGKDLDMAEMFQETTEQADEREVAWHKSFALFKKEWSDESTPELEARLSSIDAPHAAIWMAELLTEMSAIQEKHPELRA